jgi:hypothetical protein
MPARWTAAGVSKLLGYYNSIEAIKREGGTNAALWDEVHGIEAEGGPVTSGATIFDMNEVARRASAVIEAEGAFAAGAESGALTGDMWTWAPWSTATTAAWGTPEYQVRYQYETVSPEGEIGLSWGQTDWSGSLPDSPADILAQINQSAQSNLDTYSPFALQQAGIAEGSGLGSITAVQLLRV